MKIIFSFFTFLLFTCTLLAQKGTTPTYEALMAHYTSLATEYPNTSKLVTMGPTDSGEPLRLFLISSDGDFSPEKDGRITVFINNGIHPGEPAGINASMQFAEEILSDSLPKHVLFCIVPVYNIGGMLNRGTNSRANQNGPEAYGFRGNAKNLDLNRDFIKQDSKNARTLAAALQKFRPHIFIDTHTSNGADYQHVMTLITSMDEHFSPMMANYISRDMVPYLYQQMDAAGFPMIPYINSLGETPETGLMEFLDYPRYSTGYTALFNTIGFMPEVHMLKPFDTRVAAMLEFLRAIENFAAERGMGLKTVRDLADTHTMKVRSVVVNWTLDTSDFEIIPFKGFEAEHLKSDITGQQRLRYNRSKPFSRDIRYYNTYTPSVSVELPSYYIIPQAWTEVITRLQLNGVQMSTLAENAELKVKGYYIEDYGTVTSPYEGHYMHYNTKVKEAFFKKAFLAGDYVIKTDQMANTYIANVLYPGAPDSFFNWNFFDACLMQKEYYSDYVFEDLAVEILGRNKKLKAVLDAKKAGDADFASDAKAQLDFIYLHSPYYEPSHNLLPVFEIGAENLKLNPVKAIE